MDEQQNIEQKKSKAKETQALPFSYFLCGLFREVLDGQKPMQEAEKLMRVCVADMAPEEKKEWREKAPEFARRVMSIAEGFSQAIVVAGSRQWGE